MMFGELNPPRRMIPPEDLALRRQIADQYGQGSPGIAGHRVHRIPASHFPLTIILTSEATGAELYRVVCERPANGRELESVYVPGREQLGEPVRTRVEFANGTVLEVPAP